MKRRLLGNRPEDFLWATGIEDTFVPQERRAPDGTATMRSLDEYQLMGHYEHWREDLGLLKELGVQAVRWGIPWYKVEPKRGQFDWQWTDQVLPYITEELGITVILDLMHYGCPFWLQREFLNPEYPEAVAAYAKAVAERYHSMIQYYTPLNEPVVNAIWCGKRGVWPPYLKGESGYLKIMLQLAKGIVRTVEAIRSVDPESVMVHVEATGLSRAATDELSSLALEEADRNYLALDLVSGRISRDHPLFSWLVRSGVSAQDLADLRKREVKLDVIGLNFYPQWSTQHLYLDNRGKLAYRAAEPEGDGFVELIKQFYNRYQVPIMVTETSAFGSDELRSRWLEASVRGVKSLRADYIPVVAYTWFPLFTMVDWRYRTGRDPVDHYRMELGMYKLRGAIGEVQKSAGDWGLGSSSRGEQLQHSPHDHDPSPQHSAPSRWESTSLVEQFKGYIKDPSESIGPLITSAFSEFTSYIG